MCQKKRKHISYAQDSKAFEPIYSTWLTQGGRIDGGAPIITSFFLKTSETNTSIKKEKTVLLYTVIESYMPV